MNVVIHGTKGGWNILFPKTSSIMVPVSDVRAVAARPEAEGQTAYSIAYVDGECAFSKYKIIRDMRAGMRIGYIAVSLFVEAGKKLDGESIKTLLDKIMSIVCPENKIVDYIPPNEIQSVLFAYEQNPVSTDYEDYRQPDGDAAYIYCSDDEIIRYFNEQNRDEFSQYKQIYLINSVLRNQLQNPLNALKHNPSNELIIDLNDLHARYPHSIAGDDNNSKNISGSVQVPDDPMFGPAMATTSKAGKHKKPGGTGSYKGTLPNRHTKKNKHVKLKRLGITFLCAFIVGVIFGITYRYFFHNPNFRKQFIQTNDTLTNDSILKMGTETDTLSLNSAADSVLSKNPREEEPALLSKKQNIATNKPVSPKPSSPPKRDTVNTTSAVRKDDKGSSELLIYVLDYVRGDEIKLAELEDFDRRMQDAGLTKSDEYKALNDCIKFRNLLKEVSNAEPLTNLYKNPGSTYSTSTQWYKFLKIVVDNNNKSSNIEKLNKISKEGDLPVEKIINQYDKQ